MKGLSMKTNESLKEVMQKAIEQARKTMNDNVGGPFGAAVIDADGKLISLASNSVLDDHDPTAHAEMNAIRKAGQVLGTHDLSGCTVITTAFPCAMCLGAIIWANVKTVVYGARPEDAAAIGFRDAFIYEFINDNFNDPKVLSFDEQEREACLTLFEEYQKKNKEMY